MGVYEAALEVLQQRRWDQKHFYSQLSANVGEILCAAGTGGLSRKSRARCTQMDIRQPLRCLTALRILAQGGGGEGCLEHFFPSDLQILRSAYD